MVKEIAPKPLDHARGSKFDYSNLGYIIAGAILERLGAKTWEELVTERIIDPLGCEERRLWSTGESRKNGRPASPGMPERASVPLL
jgi:CubicO group peptidase (beta-lactamase class C family)